MPLLVNPSKSTDILKMLNSINFVKRFPLLPPTCGSWNQQAGSQLSPAWPQFHSHWALCRRKAVCLVTVRMTKWDEESSDAAVLHTKWLPTHCFEPSQNLLFNKTLMFPFIREDFTSPSAKYLLPSISCLFICLFVFWQ